MKKGFKWLKTAWEISRFGANPWSRVRLFFLSLWSLVQMKVPGLAKFRKERRIWLKFAGVTFPFYFYNYLDILILKDIFLDGEYKFQGEENFKTIMDLGSSVGLSSIYFSLKFPGAKVYAFEPDPITFERLQKNTKFFPNISLFKQAVSDQTGKLKFYLSPTSVSSSLVPRKEGMEEIEVETVSLSSLLEKLAPENLDLLKFDIEGEEYKMFKGSRDYLKKIKTLIGEVHNDLMGVEADEFQSLFASDFDSELIPLSSKRYIFRGTLK